MNGSSDIVGAMEKAARDLAHSPPADFVAIRCSYSAMHDLQQRVKAVLQSSVVDVPKFGVAVFGGVRLHVDVWLGSSEYVPMTEAQERAWLALPGNA